MKSGTEGRKGNPLVSEQRAPHPVRARFPPAGYLAGRQGNLCCGHLTGEEAGSFPVAAGIAQGGVCVGRKSPPMRVEEKERSKWPPPWACTAVCSPGSEKPQWAMRANVEKGGEKCYNQLIDQARRGWHGVASGRAGRERGKCDAGIKTGSICAKSGRTGHRYRDAADHGARWAVLQGYRWLRGVEAV